MNQQIVHMALLVKEYDEAISFYTEKLRFELIEDTWLSEAKRWVLVRPKGKGSCSLLLAKASGEEQLNAVGHQSGGTCIFIFYTLMIFWRGLQ